MLVGAHSFQLAFTSSAGVPDGTNGTRNNRIFG